MNIPVGMDHLQHSPAGGGDLVVSPDPAPGARDVEGGEGGAGLGGLVLQQVVPVSLRDLEASIDRIRDWWCSGPYNTGILSF